MGENSKIEWCDHTMNFWVGCTKVSAACDFCYAESWAKRSGHPELWAGERRRTAPANWRQPHKWNLDRLGINTPRARVFNNSLADFFDNQIPVQWRREAWHVIDQTPNLDWLILTKRPQNIAKMLPEADGGYSNPWGDGWPNVWLGTTCENQEIADRNISVLLSAPAAVRFLSLEPLLGPIDFRKVPGFNRVNLSLRNWWVIVGGESGPHARPMHPDWARSLRNQCANASVPFFFKQWGEWAPHAVTAGGDLGGDVRSGRVSIVHPTGQTDFEVSEATGGHGTIPGSRYMARVGKKTAGRLLDGREHNGMPGGADV